jgi:hypothetical protein
MSETSDIVSPILDAPRSSKYKNVRTGKYASKHESEVAANLWALHRSGKIEWLEEQVHYILVPGKNGVRPIKYIADFVWKENGVIHVGDAKGFKNPLFRLKEKMMYLILGITIELL